MGDGERVAIVALDWALALVLATAIGGSALQLGVAWQAGGAALAGFTLGLGAMGWAGRRPRRFALPAFAVPDWPARPVAEGAGGVVQLPRRLPTPGELDARIKAHLDGRAPHTAEVIELRADASAALRQALAGLKRASS